MSIFPQYTPQSYILTSFLISICVGLNTHSFSTKNYFADLEQNGKNKTTRSCF